jgi:hypothetical protein
MGVFGALFEAAQHSGRHDEISRDDRGDVGGG